MKPELTDEQLEISCLKMKLMGIKCSSISSCSKCPCHDKDGIYCHLGMLKLKNEKTEGQQFNYS
jgi:hypothetical protein